MTELRKVLIANRGEIAVRIAWTLRRMGIAPMAVFHAIDRDAPHREIADEAVEIFGEPPVRAYLDAGQLIAAAVEKGADAVHPGYGFLSENALFAQAVIDAGLTWIGPNPRAITLMGDKIRSNICATDAGVSIVPGALAAIDDPEAAADAAQGIGFPVMLKAAAGGGGRGLRVAHAPAQMKSELALAAAEAKAAFGDGRIFIEKYIERARHIEVQVFGDRHGNVVHLGERECSIQRRNQKIIEETPSPQLHEKTREAMSAQAVELARSVAYDNAGTVEFVLGNDGSFYFIEMNTRLQVEHPVTEMVTQLDLVEWQVRVAAGERLPLDQSGIQFDGCAIELRICAEDPDQDFMPTGGRILALEIGGGRTVRFDSGVKEGQRISSVFDSLLGKLIVHAPTRDAAIAQLCNVISESAILGFSTNLPYLGRILATRGYRAGDIHTGFLQEHAAILHSKRWEPEVVIAASALLDPKFRQIWEESPHVLRAIGAWRN